MRSPTLPALWCFLVITGCAPQKSLDAKNSRAEDLSSAIDSKHYIFKARTALPMSGRSRQLSSEYDIRITGDTLVSYLPYFGRAYAAPMDPSRGGIQFTSVKFEYDVVKREKGGWNIRLRPQDVKEVREFILTVSAEGYGSLQATSINRQPISFNGYLEPFSGLKK